MKIGQIIIKLLLIFPNKNGDVMAVITGNLNKLQPIITGNYGSVNPALNPNSSSFYNSERILKIGQHLTKLQPTER